MPDANFMASNIARYPKGGVLVTENDPMAKGMFFVLQGSIGIYKNFKLNGEEQIRALNKGDFYGEFPLFLNGDHRYSLVALTDTVVLTITRRNLNDFLSSQPDIATGMIEILCRRLLRAEEELEKINGADKTQGVSKKSTLFPEGHGIYELVLPNDSEVLYDHKLTCPICGYNFTGLGVISSKLRLERTDPDMRVRYKDIEPLYYDIITCPSCFLSAQAEAFPGVSKKFEGALGQKIGPYKLDLYVKTGRERDTFSVFAGYYLAILSASVCFDDYQTVTASLWQKLSRVYQDCGDDAMFRYASRKSLDDYLYSYQNFHIQEKLIPQYLYVIGELHVRLGEIDTARNYIFQAKTNKAITPQLRRQADLKLDELKELLMKMKAEQKN